MTATRGGTSAWQPSRPLSRYERLLLALEILGAYAKVRYVLVRHRALPDALAVLRQAPEELKHDDWRTPVEAGIRLGHAVIRTLAVLPTDSRCLMRSLVLLVVLNHRGVTVDLVIGVRSTGDEFAAHAWVEHGGCALLPPGEDFVRLGDF